MERRIFEIHHRIKLKLDAICQEAGDMNTEEFMEVYESLKHDSPNNPANEHELIELRNVNKLARERMLDLENELTEANRKIEELEEAVAKYDFLD